jgi:ATP-dependent DNA helicase DinG
MSTISHSASSIFSPAGALAALTGYEHRPQQEQMAEAIANALQHQHHLIVEAPTGVGKTLAYLVPAILYALQEDRKAIVSTHTKNLQEQIFRKDIPLVHAVLGLDFRAMVLKGRRNYLCTTRLTNALASTASMFNDEELHQLERIRDWSTRTTDGDVENLGFVPDRRVWDLVCSEKEICSSSLCKMECFFQRVKERVRSAQLVIVNHALFFTLLEMQDTDDFFIFENDFVIFDEAHTLESVAGVGLGKNLSRSQALAAVNKLYNSNTKKGLLAGEKRALKALCEHAELSIVEFFERVRNAALHSTPSSNRKHNAALREARIRIPHLIANTATGPLNELQHAVQKLEAEASTDIRRQELAAARRSLWEADVLIREFLDQPEEDFTYWVELGGARGEQVTLCASPTEIADRIGPKLFRDKTSVIMTSATLTVDGRLEYFKSRMGATAVEGLVLDSPFDHMRQMQLTLAKDIPEPDKEGFITQLPARILQSIERSHGKALVLFTSNALMQAMAKELATTLDERGWQLLVQGGDMPRHELLEEFKRDIHSVLFGLDSFWMGIDVPGEALEHVIITRLPFAVPNHPLIEARLELIEQRGGNAFVELTLPEAVLKFRQGVGRLLRSRTDKGMVTILDPRILTRRYGQLFISSLPKCPVYIISADGETEQLSTESW